MQFDVNVFDQIDTEQKAYILGILQCDGAFSCKTPDKKGYYRYKLSLSEHDSHILYDIQRYLGHTGKINIQPRKAETHQPLYELSLNGKLFCEKLERIFGGFHKNSRIKIPEIPDHLIRHYVRGVFDADGSITIFKGRLTDVRIDGKEAFLVNLKSKLSVIENAAIRNGNGPTTKTLRLVNSEKRAFLDEIYRDLSPASLRFHRKHTKYLSISESTNKCA